MEKYSIVVSKDSGNRKPEIIVAGNFNSLDEIAAELGLNPPKKAAPKKATPKKAAPKKAAPKKAATKKAPVKKPTPKKAPVKKVAKKVAPKRKKK